MTTQDVELADALWTRYKTFTQKKKYYDALLDIGAAYRLLSLSQDPRLQEVHQEWVLAYQRYTDSQVEGDSKTEIVEKLEALLHQVKDRRHS